MLIQDTFHSTIKERFAGIVSTKVRVNSIPNLNHQRVELKPKAAVQFNGRDFRKLNELLER
jgi:hypothetical protein